MTYENSVAFENISVNNTTTIPLPTSLPESDIAKDTENCTVCFFDLEATGFRFQLLILNVRDCLISMFIQMEALPLGQQKLQVLQSHQESCFVMES